MNSLHSQLRNTIRKLAFTPPGMLLRDLTGYRPANYVEPPFQEVVSDAFFWRIDDQIQTRFDLINLPSFILPEQPATDNILLILFDRMGRELGRRSYTLEPFEMRSLLLHEVEPSLRGHGFFSVFHRPVANDTPLPWELKTCLSDRSYMSYKRPGSDNLVWSYVHGCCNSHVLSYDFESNRQRIVSRYSMRKNFYAPQVRYDDCDTFELVFTNPTRVKTELKIVGFDKTNRPRELESRTVRSLETQVIKFDNSDRSLITLRHQSNLFAWRPMVFKHYSSHFDVFHS